MVALLVGSAIGGVHSRVFGLGEIFKFWHSAFFRVSLKAFSTYELNQISTCLKPFTCNFRFIEDEYIQHCVPENIATGLSSLPLKYIYVNGSQTNTETTQKLPSGETLKGLDSYLKLLQHFTTNSQTPENIYKLGEEMLSKLYVEVGSLPVALHFEELII